MELDILRYIAIVLANSILFIAAKVVYNYTLASRRELKKGEWKGILPMHVYLISTSYCLLIVASLYRHIQHIGEAITPTFVLSVTAYGTGLIALWVILRYEERRVKAGRMQDDTETQILRQTIQSMLEEDGLIIEQDVKGAINQTRRRTDKRRKN